MDAFSLSGLRALVTGGSRGIGLALARGLAEAGADIVLLSRDPAGLEAARGKLASTGRTVDVHPFDMERTSEVAAMFHRIVEGSGPVDILVNAAGVVLRGPAEEVSLADWDHTIQLNLTAVFALSQAFARERIESRRKGRIILIASLMSEGARRNCAPYAASKGGIRQLTKALAVEWARHGINVNAIGPGYIQTDLTRPLWTDPDFDAWVRGRTPLGRWGVPEDLASTAVFLASPASDFVTGQIVYVDGGWLATF